MMGLEEPLITPKRGFSIARVAVPAAIGLCLAFAIFIALVWQPGGWQSAFVNHGILWRSDWLLHVNYSTNNDFILPTPSTRCSFVIDQIMQHNNNHSEAMLRAKFKVQSRDVNSFYR